MDDLSFIFSHHNNGETSRKQHEEEDEKANSLSCIISFNKNNFENCFLIPKAEANNSISFSHINDNIGTQFGGNARRTREQAHEHLLAERNRRRKINKLFVSLASLLPDLNKMDKVSILEGATTLIRQLGERAKTNDHQSSIYMMKKSGLPEVEVKRLEKELFITILLLYKRQQKGIIDEILSVIQSLHLTIKTTNFMPFGSTTMYIMVIAQMNAEFCETTDFLAEKLRSSIIKV